MSAHVASNATRDDIGEPRTPPLAGAIYAAFFLSGVAGLMHEVVWAKQLVQLIGATAHAQAVVLAVFMGGLALGSAGFGRWVDRHGRPLRACPRSGGSGNLIRIIGLGPRIHYIRAQ